MPNKFMPSEGLLRPDYVLRLASRVLLPGFARGTVIVLLARSVGPQAGLAQDFRIESAASVRGTVQISYQARGDSYYFLHGGSSLAETLSPVAALLGKDGSQVFQHAASGGSMFFRVEQIPLTSTNSFLADGIPDAWKLQHGISPLEPNVANQIPLGDTRTWLQIYQADAQSAQLPLAYFPQTGVTVVAGNSNLTVQVAFTKPFTGRLNYQLRGTAIPDTATLDRANGDYVQPVGFVDVAGSTQAVISIALVVRQAVEADRTLLIALTGPLTNQNYTIGIGSSICTVRLAQSLQGTYVGTLAITKGMPLSAQSVKMAFRSGAGGGTVALIDVTGNPLLGDSLFVPATVDASGFQLTGNYRTQITGTPFGRPISLSLSFGSTEMTTGGSLVTPVSLAVDGLTASAHQYVGTGMMILSRVQ
jgi:hypothetical protein